MNTDKLLTIISKEWAEVFKNKMVFFTTLFMPLLFTALPLVILYATREAGAEAMDEIPAQFATICPERLTGGECFQYYMASQFLLLFMMLPLIIPINIAAYSIVGEKTTRSLEPLLATPITTFELLSAKNLAAAIPAILATWFGFGLFVLGAAIITGASQVVSALVDPLWLIAVLVVGPLLAILAVNFALMVSSRVNDPRVAEQLSAVVILPLLVLFFGQISGFLILNQQLILVLSGILFLIDLLMIFLATSLFQREAILTRWK